MDKLLEGFRTAIENNIEKMLKMAGVEYKNVNEANEKIKEKGLRIDILNNKDTKDIIYMLRDTEKDYYAFKISIGSDSVSISDIVEV